MARGGINKAVVQKARQSLLDKGLNPSIDAVRVELGNTGSKSTIHRYLKEIEAFDPRPVTSRERISDELNELVERLLERLIEEGNESIAQSEAVFDERRKVYEVRIQALENELSGAKRDVETQGAALGLQNEQLQTTQSSLQTELNRNARLSQNCSDLELRVQDKDSQINSLEEKHKHARGALEHYRQSMKEQRDQDQRRHETQIQQIQGELRQLQQMLIVKQEELTGLNRDNERLLSESLQTSRRLCAQEEAHQRQSVEIQGLKLVEAKAIGVCEALRGQIAGLQSDSQTLREQLVVCDGVVRDLGSQLAASKSEVERLRAEISSEPSETE